MSITYLKIKLKSIAAEAPMIRREERKCRSSTRWMRKNPNDEKAFNATMSLWGGLHTHRMELRAEQRSAYLAYAFLRGRAYSQVEPKPCWVREIHRPHAPHWKRVRELIIKYGTGDYRDKDAVDKTLVKWVKDSVGTEAPGARTFSKAA